MKVRQGKRVAFIVSSSGGHLEQALRLTPALNNYKFYIITEKNDVTKTLTEEYDILYLPHSSGEHKILVFVLLIWNLIVSFIRILMLRPAVIISTGAHTGVPSCLIGALLRKKVIFIETFAKVNTPTISGRIIYPFANLFLVQWEELLSSYPKAKYWGKIY